MAATLGVRVAPTPSPLTSLMSAGPSWISQAGFHCESDFHIVSAATSYVPVCDAEYAGPSVLAPAPIGAASDFTITSPPPPRFASSLNHTLPSAWTTPPSTPYLPRISPNSGK